MTRLKLSRWLAVLTLAIALASSTPSVLEADILNSSGTFHMDQLTGTVGADLAEVFAHDNENTWSLTLFGITQSNEVIDHSDNGADAEELITQVHATSFDSGFSGPDADVLNDRPIDAHEVEKWPLPVVTTMIPRTIVCRARWLLMGSSGNFSSLLGSFIRSPQNVAEQVSRWGYPRLFSEIITHSPTHQNSP